jgi:ATP-dependent helicase HrpB
VKKELKGRYPRHHWPDDPLRAKPISGAKRRHRD